MNLSFRMPRLDRERPLVPSAASVKWNMLSHILVSAVAILIFVTDISNSGLWYPAAPSHALNGVFYKDAFNEQGFLHPVKYAERYYVQYPILTVGLYPPIFYVVEGTLYQLLGVSPMVSKLAVLLFSILGVNVFFLLCRHWFSVSLCIIGCVLFLLQPVTLFGQRNVMLEMPAVAMSTTALYFLYTSFDSQRRSALLLAPVLTSLAFLTKQNTVFLLLVWLIWGVLSRKWRVLKSGYLISGICLGCILLAPWVVVSSMVGRSYIAEHLYGKHSMWGNSLFYFRHASEIMSYPMISLATISVLLLSRLKRYVGYRFAVVWAGSAVLILVAIGYPDRRNGSFMVPALILLSLFVIELLREKSRRLFGGRTIYAVTLAVLILIHVAAKGVWASPDIRGPQEVADFVLADSDCISVLYDGMFNGYFTFCIRVHDEERRVFVFRASKVVFSTKMMPNWGYIQLLDQIGEFYDVLRKYGVKYVVQEENDLIGTPANRMLRNWIIKGDFSLVYRSPVSFQKLEGFGDLMVYRYLGYERHAISEIELDMPALGRRIKVELGRKE